MMPATFERLRDIYTRHGVWGALGLLPHNAALAVRAWSPARRRARRRELEFDRRHGVDTTSHAPVSALGVDTDSARHAVAYKPSGIDFVRNLLAALDIRYEDYCFIDLGCGKGRTLLIASHFPFRRILGVEFSAKLTAIARANIAAYRPAEQRCRQIEVMTADAAAFVPPDGPLVLYLYNAFDDVILARVAAKLDASLTQAPRDVLLLYVNPEQRAVLDRMSRLRVVQDADGTVIYRAR